MPKTQPPLSAVLPSLIFGTATFNYQYNADPLNLPTTELVHKALAHGVRAFDTSPYYGPSEEILGKALVATYERTGQPAPRNTYHIITKVGRISSDTFDYSATWVRKSIARSLERLHTPYLDVVYCHDVEFVTPAEVLVAITELRRLRDEEKTIRYVGISGYPIDVLADLAELVVRETGEPLDCVMSYANYTLQNTRLHSHGVERFRAAGVDVVPNASILGMGLLRRGGVPVGSLGNWHPAPEGLRQKVHDASLWCDSQGEKIENVAIRWALENWLHVGASVGSSGDPASGIAWDVADLRNQKLGVSVMGVSRIEELEETMRVWRSVLDGLEGGSVGAVRAGRAEGDHVWSLERRARVEVLARGIWEVLGTEWREFHWASPGEEFVRGEVDKS